MAHVPDVEEYKIVIDKLEPEIFENQLVHILSFGAMIFPVCQRQSHRLVDIAEDDAHARAQGVLGRYYSKVDQSELALFHYSEALEAMTEAGDVQSLVEITMLLGEVLQDAGRTDEAMEHYSQALVLAEANDLRMQIGELLTRLGGVAPDRQGRMEYLQRALTVFRELGAKARMREVQTMVHRAVMSR